MALRTPLSVTPHLYMGDSTGRPLDKGVVYFGEQDKDPEFYPINLFSDDELTKPLAQPVHTKGGYLYDKGDMVEPHAKEIIYSVKVLDSYGRKVFYKGAMMRNSWNDDVIEQINTAIIDSADAARQVAIDITNDALNNTAVEGGVLADTFVVVDGSLSQRTINKGLESIADLSTIKNPKNGLRVYVKSYRSGLNKGGGYFTYDSSQLALNDGGLFINGWVREWDKTHVKPEWWGAVGDRVTDDTVAIQKALNYASGAHWQGSGYQQPRRGGSLPVVLSNTVYRTTDTLWIGAEGVLLGSGRKSGFHFYNNNHSMIETDFGDDPYKAAISTANFNDEGDTIPFGSHVNGQAFDSGSWRGTSNVKIHDVTVSCAEGTRGLIGIRVQLSPGSDVKATALGYDVGFQANACWHSTFDCLTLHMLCGMLAQYDNHGMQLEGYYNSKNGGIEPLKNVDMLSSIRSEWRENQTLQDRNSTFGVIGYYNASISGRTIISEKNTYGVYCCRSPMNYGSMYLEANKKSDILGVNADLDIGTMCGYWGNDVLELGTNCKVDIQTFSRGGFDGVACSSFLKWNSYLSIPLNFPQYVKGANYKGSERTIYVNSSTGNDSHNGMSTSYAIKSVDEALKRINEYSTELKSKVSGTVYSDWVIVLLNSDVPHINESRTTILNTSITIKSIGNDKVTLHFNSYLSLNNSKLYFSNVDITRKDSKWLATGGKENGLFWLIAGKVDLIFYNSTVDLGSQDLLFPHHQTSTLTNLILDRSKITGTSESLICEDTWGASHHKILVKKDLASTIDSRILDRADKGFVRANYLHYEFIGYPTIEKITTGTTEQRPTGVSLGFTYFDTSLGKPIYWKGSAWVDSTGTTV